MKSENRVQANGDLYGTWENSNYFLPNKHFKFSWLEIRLRETISSLHINVEIFYGKNSN